MIIGLTGYVKSGKDSVANMLAEHIGGWTKAGFADALREMASIMNPRIRVGASKHYAEADGTARYNDLLKVVGYNAAKSFPDVREFLQRLGTEAVRDVIGKDTWVNILMGRIWQARVDASLAGQPAPNYAITDVRFPNEAEAIKQADGYIVRVVRPGKGPVNEHISEQSAGDIVADWTLEASTLEELLEEVYAFYPELLAVEAQRVRQRAEQTAQLDALKQAVVGAVQTEFTATVHSADETPNANGVVVEPVQQ
jgi:hypothetical protein